MLARTRCCCVFGLATSLTGLGLWLAPPAGGSFVAKFADFAEFEWQTKPQEELGERSASRSATEAETTKGPVSTESPVIEDAWTVDAAGRGKSCQHELPRARRDDEGPSQHREPS